MKYGRKISAARAALVFIAGGRYAAASCSSNSPLLISPLRR